MTTNNKSSRGRQSDSEKKDSTKGKSFSQNSKKPYT